MDIIKSYHIIKAKLWDSMNERVRMQEEKKKKEKTMPKGISLKGLNTKKPKEVTPRGPSRAPTPHWEHSRYEIRLTRVAKNHMLNSYVWVIIFNLPPIMTKIHFYLPNNLMLIILQCPLESLLNRLRLQNNNNNKNKLSVTQCHSHLWASEICSDT